MQQNLTQSVEFSHEKHERFDGHFFRAILTTGIFCRPICPSRPARAENVQFFTTAAAAAEAGFRPCLRCRPESAPDRPENIGVSPFVNRALQLIAEDVAGNELAVRLHISPRQLRRRFVQELGAPPVAIMQTRRLLFAKKLIDETQLPMTEVAFSAGYQSVRRFNTAIRQTYGRTPTELRSNRRNGKQANTPDTVSLKLFYRPPYQWELMWGYLAKRAIAGMEIVQNNTYHRTIRFGADVGILTVKSMPKENCLWLQIPKQLSRHLLHITERLKRQFDLRMDPRLIHQQFINDSVLAELVEAYAGIRIPGAWDGFETAVRTLLGQQVSVTTAATLIERLVTQFGTTLPQEEGAILTHLFPMPSQLVDADIAKIGIPKKRAETIRIVAQTFVSDKLVWQANRSLADIVTAVTELPGIGDWTAQLIAMRLFGETDAFPANDLILCKAVAPPNCLPTSAKALTKMAEAWQPWRAYAAQLLWAKQANS